MDRFFNLLFSPLHNSDALTKLVAVWGLGVLGGAHLSCITEESASPMVCAMLYADLSFERLFVVLLVPFFLSFFSVYTSWTFLLFPTAFIKSFLFAFLATSISTTFSSAGWLIAVLCLMGDFLTLPLLWFVWKRALVRPMQRPLCSALAVLFLVLVVCSLNVYIIEPFLSGLI